MISDVLDNTCGHPPPPVQSSSSQVNTEEAVSLSYISPSNAPLNMGEHKLHKCIMQPSLDSLMSQKEAVATSWEVSVGLDATNPVEKIELKSYNAANVVIWFQTYPLWILLLRQVDVGTV